MKPYRYTHPTTGKKSWRVMVAAADGSRKTRQFSTKADAEAWIDRRASESGQGFVFSDLDHESRRFLEQIHRAVAPGLRESVLRHIRAIEASCTLADAVVRYLAHKATQAGATTPYLRTVGSCLRSLATAHPAALVCDLDAAALAGWLDVHYGPRSAKTRRDVRGHLVGLYRWMQRQGIVQDAVTAADRLPTPKVAPGDRRILTPAQLCEVLNAAAPEFRAWCVLGAFAGLRPEEISPGPSKRGDRRGIYCEEIDFQFRVIRVPECVSKVARPRIVPMSDALVAALQWAGIESGMTGPTTLLNPSQAGELARLGRAIFKSAWPKDCLRHSFGSYRNALVRSLDQVAEEMGTSVGMLHRHYHNPQPEAAGEEWFALRPARGTWEAAGRRAS